MKQTNKYIIHEVHGEGGKTLDGETLYWAKVRKVKLPTEQYQCQSYVKGGKVIDCICGKCF